PRCCVVRTVFSAGTRGSRVKTHRALWSIAAAIFVSTLGAEAPNGEEASSRLSPQALQEIAQVEAEIDRIEAQTLERLATLPDNQTQQVELLGKSMLYDKNLSVYRNEACAFCHMPEKTVRLCGHQHADVVVLVQFSNLALEHAGSFGSNYWVGEAVKLGHEAPALA